MDVKKEIFGRLDKIAKPGAILASNTSYLNIDEIAAGTSRPQDVVGLHFFSPANVMKLLEVVRGAKTAPDVLVTAMQLAKKIKKVAVVAGVCYGFIGNRMLMPRQVAGRPSCCSKARRPNRSTASMSNSACRWGRSRWPTSPGSTSAGTATRRRIENLRDALVRRSTAGARRRAPASTIMTTSAARRPSPVRAGDHRGLRRQRRASSSAKFRTRKSSSARSTRWSTRARRSSRKAWRSARRDIDVVWIYGYGWPVYRGGPMHWADSEGLQKIVDGLKAQEGRMGSEFSFSQVVAGQSRGKARNLPAERDRKGLGDERLYGRGRQWSAGDPLWHVWRSPSTGSPRR